MSIWERLVTGLCIAIICGIATAALGLHPLIAGIAAGTLVWRATRRPATVSGEGE